MPWPYWLMVALVSVAGVASLLAIAFDVIKRRTVRLSRAFLLLSSSTTGRPNLLFALRVIEFLFSTIFLICHLTILGISQLQFFPVWNMALFVIYSLISSFVSFREAIFRYKTGHDYTSPIKPMRMFARINQILFTISLVMAIMLPIGKYGLELPYAMSSGQPWSQLEKIYFNAWSYNMHGVKPLLTIMEFMLNTIPVDIFDFTYVALWSSIYVTFMIVWQAVTGLWIYSELVDGQTFWTPVVLGGFVFAELILTCSWTLIYRFKMTRNIVIENNAIIFIQSGSKSIGNLQGERKSLINISSPSKL